MRTQEQVITKKINRWLSPACWLDCETSYGKERGEVWWKCWQEKICWKNLFDWQAWLISLRMVDSKTSNSCGKVNENNQPRCRLWRLTRWRWELSRQWSSRRLRGSLDEGCSRRCNETYKDEWKEDKGRKVAAAGWLAHDTMESCGRDGKSMLVP